MEKIYPPEVCCATEPQDLNTYFEDYQAEAKIKSSSNEIFQDRLESIKEDFDLPLSLEDVKSLEDLCTIDKLKILHENPKLPLKKIPDDKGTIEIHKITNDNKHLHSVKNKLDYNVIKEDYNICNQRGNLDFSVDNNKAKESTSIEDIHPGSDYIQNIIVFTPFNTMSSNRLTTESIRIHYEIEILGSNTLEELANCIECVSDKFVTMEVPNMDTHLNTVENPKTKYPSRCFFIENTFFNDMSNPNAIDYSEVVRKWALEQDIGILKSKSLEGITINSLKPRLGYGYVYIHQGNCEHIICFSDARLIQSTDCLISQKYPKIVFLKRHSNYLCFICSERHSSWMVTNSDRLPVAKAFFCSKCLESYMFLNGEKLGEFQLYPYHMGTAVADQQKKCQQDNSEVEEWSDEDDL